MVKLDVLKLVGEGQDVETENGRDDPFGDGGHDVVAPATVRRVPVPRVGPFELDVRDDPADRDQNEEDQAEH